MRFSLLKQICAGHKTPLPVPAPVPAIATRDGKPVEEAVSLAFQLFHIFMIYFHRVFLFYPAVASLYLSVFNALRSPACMVTVHDFFYFWQVNQWRRLLPLASLLFLLHFAFSLNWFMFPLFIYVATITAFALPLRVDHPHLDPLTCVVQSAVIANSHLGPLLLFITLGWVAVVVSIFAFFVGFYVVFPVVHIALAFSFHHLVGVVGVKHSLEPMSIA